MSVGNGKNLASTRSRYCFSDSGLPSTVFMLSNVFLPRDGVGDGGDVGDDTISGAVDRSGAAVTFISSFFVSVTGTQPSANSQNIPITQMYSVPSGSVATEM